MKYLSIDIETTGLDPETCNVLEVAAYLEDTEKKLPREELPLFHKYIYQENYQGEPYALAMNNDILEKIMFLKKKTDMSWGNMDRELVLPEEVWNHMGWWMYSLKKLWPGTEFDNDTMFIWNAIPRLPVAGKNVAGFDLPFLRKLPGNHIPFYHRTLDPAILYFDLSKDKAPPDLKTCKERAGLDSHVAHTADDDAWDVIQLLRHKLY